LRDAGNGLLRSAGDGARVAVLLQYVRGDRPAGGCARALAQSPRLMPGSEVMDLKDLYRDVIVDHNRRPRNFGRLDPVDAHADGYNPLCGPRLTLYVTLDGERIREAKFEGSGCAISVASASLLTEAVKGKSRAEVREL